MKGAVSYKLYAFWKARPESPESCAQHMARMFEELAAIHPAFSRWYEQTMDLVPPPDKPFCTMPPRVEELAAKLYAGRHIADASGEVMPQLGYSISAWNGNRGSQGLALLMNFGAYTERMTEPNRFNFNFHKLEPGNESLLNAKVLEKVLLAVVSAWDADWGVIETWGYEGRLKNADGQLFRPWGGWITYLSPGYASRISPPRNVKAEKTPNGGLLILATEEPFNAGNPAHVAAVDAVQACLKPIQIAPPLRGIQRPAQ